jgi:SpoVK/Ycf46/Vps4 family AAA+-type ATPase
VFPVNYLTEVLKIIEGGIKKDSQKIVDYSLLLSQKLIASGELKKGERIQKLIKEKGFLQDQDNATIISQGLTELKQLPFDQESNLELADTYLPIHLPDRKLILSDDNEFQIIEFIDAYSNSDLLVSHGLDLPTTMILFGPPGCGKTETAFYLARKLNLPIVVARLDTMISSYLGSTAKNIRRLFDYAAKNPCILFLDEFDAVAKIRDDTHELGELKRVVNSLLQNIDQLNGKSILIAATNHENLLDSAIWRRFSSRIHIDFPNYDLIQTIILDMLNDVNFSLESKSIELLCQLFKGQSIADIQQILKRSFRKVILSHTELELADIIECYFDYVKNLFKTNNDPETLRREKLKYLLSVNNNLSNRFLSEILRCHHNTISKDIEKINKSGA